jgi:hypothetical protein
MIQRRETSDLTEELVERGCLTQTKNTYKNVTAN